MDQLKQLVIIIDKEIKQKGWMQANDKLNQEYYKGAMAMLKYLRHIILSMINHK